MTHLSETVNYGYSPPPDVAVEVEVRDVADVAVRDVADVAVRDVADVAVRDVADVLVPEVLDVEVEVPEVLEVDVLVPEVLDVEVEVPEVLDVEVEVPVVTTKVEAVRVTPPANTNVWFMLPTVPPTFSEDVKPPAPSSVYVCVTGLPLPRLWL